MSGELSGVVRDVGKERVGSVGYAPKERHLVCCCCVVIWEMKRRRDRLSPWVGPFKARTGGWLLL
jgi:hypothetical protein